jgi:hypothetical protein
MAKVVAQAQAIAEVPPVRSGSLLINIANAQSDAALALNTEDSESLATIFRENNLLPVFTFAAGSAMLNLNVFSLTSQADSLTVGIPCEPRVDNLDEAKLQLLKMVLSL